MWYPTHAEPRNRGVAAELLPVVPEYGCTGRWQGQDPATIALRRAQVSKLMKEHLMTVSVLSHLCHRLPLDGES